MKRGLLCWGLVLASALVTMGQTSAGLVEVSGVVVDVNGAAGPTRAAQSQFQF